MTKTSYQITGHDYTELTPCTDPQTCTTKSHWTIDGGTARTETEARELLDMIDTPAVRIYKVQVIETRELVA